MQLGAKILNKDADTKAERKTAYQDNTDRIKAVRRFSLTKRKFGLGLLLTKRKNTTKTSIAISIIAMNLDRTEAMLLRLLKFILSFFIFDDEKNAFRNCWLLRIH